MYIYVETPAVRYSGNFTCSSGKILKWEFFSLVTEFDVARSIS